MLVANQVLDEGVDVPAAKVAVVIGGMAVDPAGQAAAGPKSSAASATRGRRCTRSSARGTNDVERSRKRRRSDRVHGDETAEDLTVVFFAACPKGRVGEGDPTRTGVRGSAARWARREKFHLDIGVVGCAWRSSFFSTCGSVQIKRAENATDIF